MWIYWAMPSPGGLGNNELGFIANDELRNMGNNESGYIRKQFKQMKFRVTLARRYRFAHGTYVG